MVLNFDYGIQLYTFLNAALFV